MAIRECIFIVRKEHSTEVKSVGLTNTNVICIYLLNSTTSKISLPWRQNDVRILCGLSQL